MLPIIPPIVIVPSLAFKVKLFVSLPSESIFPSKSINPVPAEVSILIPVNNTAGPLISTLLRAVLEVTIFPPRWTAVLPVKLTV